MASRTISIRMSLENQEAVRRGLESVGAEGSTALKKIEAGTAPASKGLLALNDASRAAQGEMQALTGRLGPLGAGLSALGFAGAAAGAAIAGLTVGLKASLAAAAEAEKIELRLGAVLKATGNAAGLTKDQIIDYASSLQSSLKINDEKIKESAAALASFRAVSGPAFKEGITLAADMAAVFGGDLLSATKQIGKALQDPVEGISALRRVGVTFTDSQKELIKSLVDTGDVAGAQEVVLKELRNEIGGAAQAEAGGLSGATRGLANAWDDLLETLGRTPAVGGVAKAALSGLTGFLDTIRSQIEGPSLNQEIENLKAQIASLSKPENFVEVGGRAANAAALKERQDELAALQDSLNITDQINKRVEDRAKAAADGAALRVKWQKELNDMLADAGRESKAQADAAKEAAAAAKKAAEEKAKALKEEKDLIFKISVLVDEDLKKRAARNALTPDYIRGLQEEARLAGITGLARQQENAVLEISNRLKKEGLSLSADEEAQIRGLVAERETIAKQLSDARKAAEESARFIPEAFDRAFDRVGSAITDAFARGEDGLINLRDLGRAVAADLAQSFLQLALLNPLKNVLFGGTAATLGGVLGGGGSGGTGALGVAANGASLANFFSGGSLSAGIGAKLFGTAAFTGPLETMSATGTSGLLGSGGLSGAFGGALPIAGAGVAALGILRGLGVIGPGKSVGPNAGGQLIESGGVFSVGPTGADNGGNTAGVISELSQAVQVLNALASGIGVSQIGDGIASYIDTFGAGGIRNAADLIKNAIANGVVEGLTEGERNLIAGSQDLNAAAQHIIENRALPGQIASQRLQLENPRKFAEDAAKAERDGMVARLAEIENGTQALADVEYIYQNKLTEINKQFATGVAADWNAAGNAASNAARAANDNFNAVGLSLNYIASASQAAIEGLQNTAKSLQAFISGLDSGPLSALSLNQQYNAAKAAFGANANPETARTLLELSKQRDPGIGFARDSAQVRQLFGNTIADTPRLIAEEQARAAAAIQAESDRARTLTPDQIRSIVSTLQGTGRQDIIDPFTEILRTGGELGGSIVPQGFYKLAFPALLPGFASGGITPANRPFIVGENGPEIMRMQVPGMVTSNRDSFDNSAVVTELKEVRGRLERIDAAMVSLAEKTATQEARQRKWDTVGMPPVRVA